MDYKKEKEENRKERLRLKIEQELIRIGVNRGVNTEEEYERITEEVKKAKEKLTKIEMARIKEENKNGKHKGQ